MEEQNEPVCNHVGCEFFEFIYSFSSTVIWQVFFPISAFDLSDDARRGSEAVASRRGGDVPNLIGIFLALDPRAVASPAAKYF